MNDIDIDKIAQTRKLASDLFKSQVSILNSK